jgi:hypothetical protein
MPLFRRKPEPEPEPAPVVSDAHCVITYLPLSDDAFGTAEERDAVHRLEDRITHAVAAIGGEHDGASWGARDRTRS